MAAAGIVILADTETREAMGRAVNALMVANEFVESGEEVTVMFDGAGTKWVPELSKPNHRYHKLFEQVKDSVSGACSYCSEAYGVKDEIESSGIGLLDEYKGHPSIGKLVSNGYQVLTF